MATDEIRGVLFDDMAVLVATATGCGEGKASEGSL